MTNSKILSEGLTYEDVLLIPQYSDILPQKVNLKTRFSKNIDLNIPIIEASHTRSFLEKSNLRAICS